ncbi:MAG: cache domain-containing protein, partial [Planctomycetota bacterium]|nr:cache domain-containing protein [Planctomycetota bacterium]
MTHGTMQSLKARSSVFVKMALFVAALLLLTATLLSWVGYVVAGNIIRDQIHQRLRVAAADRHDMVLSYVAQQHERAGLVASRTKLRTRIAEFLRGEIPEQQMRSETRSILADAIEGTDGFEAIWIVGADGRVLTSTDDSYFTQDFSTDPAFQAGLKGPHLGEPSVIDGKYLTSLAAPARAKDRELLGVVMVRLDVGPLYGIVTDTRGLGETGEILIGKRDGNQVRYLFKPRDGSSSTVPLDDVPAMASAIGGMTRFDVTDYSGTQVLA